MNRELLENLIKQVEKEHIVHLYDLCEITVKECIICAEREWIRNGDTEHNRAVSKVIESIKEHFGVE